MWIRFDKDMRDYIEGIEMYHYWKATTIVMVSAALVMCNAFVACCGVYSANKSMIAAVRDTNELTN